MNCASKKTPKFYLTDTRISLKKMLQWKKENFTVYFPWEQMYITKQKTNRERLLNTYRVKIDMELLLICSATVMPQKVKILTANELLSTRIPQLLRCETSGSYPPAKIMWLLGNKAIRDASVTVSLIKG